MFFKKLFKKRKRDEELSESLQIKLNEYNPKKDVSTSTFKVDMDGIKNIGERAIIDQWKGLDK